MSVLMNMSGTRKKSVYFFAAHDPSRVVWGDVLRISVRTEDTRLIMRAFTLASSRWPPNPGSAAEAVQPTRHSTVSRCCASRIWDYHV